MRAATLFSGIGAPEVAMPHWHWLWHAEIEPFPAAVMATRYPGSVNLGDVMAPDFVKRALNVGRPDVVVFGSPCQSFSVAGKRGGMEDARGNLALVGLEVVRRLRAPWFVFENVPGMLSGGFSAFVRAVEECGYLGCWRILDAQFAGVPQRRRRVFFVGHLGDWRPAAEVLFEPASLRGDSAPSREAREGVARPLAACASGGSGYRNDCDTAENLIARPVLAGGHANNPLDENLVAHSLRAEGFDASEDGTGRGTPHHGADSGELSPTLRAMGHGDSWANGGGQVAVAFAEVVTSDVVSRLGAGGGKPGQGYPAVAVAMSEISGALHTALDTATGHGNDDRLVMQSMAVRRLTPRECEHLQGFPDDWTLIDYRGKSAADGPRYRAIGNSMAVPAVAWILRRLERVAAQQTARAA